MRSLLAAIISLTLIFSGNTLYSQDAVTGDVKIMEEKSGQGTAADKTGTEKESTGSQSKGKKSDKPAGVVKTRVFDNGAVVIRGDKPVTIDKATSHKVVTEKDIEARNDKSLDDTLNTVSGFQTYQHGKGHIRFRMRGFEMPYVAILVDGIPLADVYEANLDISKIPVMNASEIIINRGTCSALYGTTGTIGSINVLSKKPLGIYGKTSIEAGTNGDYTINMAQGDATDNFYYWLTACAEKETPFEVSGRLTKSERRKWYDKFFPDDLGYTPSTSPGADAADNEYLGNTGEWPHQEAFRYNVAGKFGYMVTDSIETGLNASYTKSEAQRYTTSLDNIETYGYNKKTGTVQWTSPGYRMGAGAFNWRDVYSVNLSPYLSFEKNDLSVKGNLFYIHTYEYLDGYGDSDELTAIRGWGGAHSNWNNTSAGFNIFPSYRLASWNNLSTSILFRWDRHEEKVQADPQFATNSNYYSAYNTDGYDWITLKDMTSEQVTAGIEDDIDLSMFNIPVNVSVGISYDAQKFDAYKKRGSSNNATPLDSTDDHYTSLEDQYIAKDDSALWGTRDSFNPVIGVVYEPLKDLLLLRSSFSKKSKLPTMSQLASVDTSAIDKGLQVETSYNTNAGFEIFFLNKSISLRTDYFFTRFDDKIATIYNTATFEKSYTNIKGEDHQGVEAIISATFGDVAGVISSIDTECSYIYLHVRNLDTGARDSNIYMGEKLADIPEHQLLADVRLNFISGTALNLFGSYTANAVKYVMAGNPPNTTDPYSASYYTTVKLHNPLMLNVKVSQAFMNRYEAFIICKNVMDDYAADPFNPGPGRQFSFGVKAEL